MMDAFLQPFMDRWMDRYTLYSMLCVCFFAFHVIKKCSYIVTFALECIFTACFVCFEANTSLLHITTYSCIAFICMYSCVSVHRQMDGWMDGWMDIPYIICFTYIWSFFEHVSLRLMTSRRCAYIFTFALECRFTACFLCFEA